MNRSRTVHGLLGLVLLSAAIPSALEAQPSIVLKDGGLEFPDGSVQTSAAEPLLNHVRVGVAGGDFQSIQAAVDSLSLVASSSNPILVEVGPGVFFEDVVLYPHIHLAGAGPDVSVVSAPGTTLTMADDTSVRDLTLRSDPPTTSAVGLLVPSGVTGVSISRVTAIATGTTDSIGIEIDGGEASIVDSAGISLDAGASGSAGCEVTNGGVGTFRTSRCEGNDTNSATGLVVTGGTVDLEGVDLVGQGSGDSGTRQGLVVQSAGTATVRGGTITAEGGQTTQTVFAQGSSVVDLTDVRILGTGATTNRGIQENGATIRARHCYVTGSSHSIYHGGTGSTLVAHSQLQGSIENVGSGVVDCWENYRVFSPILGDPEYQAVTCP